MPVSVEWNGGPDLADVRIEGSDTPEIAQFAQAHFGHGVLTFQTSYLFRTDPGVALSVRGPANQPKDGIAPLDAIVETDWLDFSFTMNWMFTRPGRIHFEKDEPFCFITPMAYRALDGLVPEIEPLAANPDEFRRYKTYAELRNDFNTKLAQKDQQAIEQGWQKWYMRGQSPLGDKANPMHLSKLRLADPRIIDKAHEPTQPAGPDLGGGTSGGKH